MSAIPVPAGAGWHRHREQPQALGSRSKSVEAVKRPPGLIPKERVLIRREDASGTAVVGTDLAVHIREDGDWRRIAWTDVDAAGWDPATSRSRLRLWPDTGRAPVVWFPADQRVAALVAERVASTQVLRRRIRLSPDALATVAALRHPGQAALRWRVRIEGPGANEETTRAAADEALTQLRNLVGS
jgi:hypothetical protein